MVTLGPVKKKKVIRKREPILDGLDFEVLAHISKCNIRHLEMLHYIALEELASRLHVRAQNCAQEYKTHSIGCAPSNEL